MHPKIKGSKIHPGVSYKKLDINDTNSRALECIGRVHHTFEKHRLPENLHMDIFIALVRLPKHTIFTQDGITPDETTILDVMNPPWNMHLLDLPEKPCVPYVFPSATVQLSLGVKLFPKTIIHLSLCSNFTFKISKIRFFEFLVISDSFGLGFKSDCKVSTGTAQGPKQPP